MDATDTKFSIFVAVIFIGILVSLYFIFNNDTMHKILIVLILMLSSFVVFLILGLLFSTGTDFIDTKFIILMGFVFMGMFMSLYFAYNNAKNKLKVILFVLFLILGIVGLVVGLLFKIPILFILGLVLFALCIVELFSDKLDNLFVSPDQNKIKLVLFFLFLIFGGALIFIGKQMGSVILFSIGIILLALSIFELFSDGLDTFFTENITKTVICGILLVLGLVSMLASRFYGMQFMILGGILLGMCMFEMFSDQFDSKSTNSKGIICIVSALLCVGSILGTIKFPEKTWTLLLISCLAFFSFIFSLFDVPGFNSSTYVFILFLLANIPVVYAFVNRLGYQGSDQMYIPLLIAFYVLSMVILYMMGSTDLADKNSIFVIFGIIAVCLLYYMKSLPLSLSKTFFTLTGMIFLFIVALHYMIHSDIWYLYLLLYTLVLFYMLKTTPLNIVETLKRYIPQPKKKEAVFLAAELGAILLYLYTRPVIQKIYAHDGKLLVNNPLHLHNLTNLKVGKHFNYTYSLSFWVYIHQNNPSSSPQATNFIPFLSYGDKPLFTYNSLRNIIRVEMKTEDKLVIVDEIAHVKLQKWNHIVVNQDNETFDIFVNGELHKSTSHVVPSKDNSDLQIGTQNGIDGNVCNVMFFKKMLTTDKIQNLYNDFHDKNPPTF